jgi:hypothetical protein
MNIKEMGSEDVDWIRLVQVKVQWRVFVNTVMNLGVPLKAGNFLNSYATIKF